MNQTATMRAAPRRWFGALVLLPALLFAMGCESMRVVGASGSTTVSGGSGTVSVGFSTRDRELIRDYYAGRRSKPLPPGLAKRDRLPPGLEKQLRKNGQLPPGLETRGLPRDLEVRLSALPGGYSRVVVAGRIVLQNNNTRVVIDLIEDLVID